MSIGAGSPRPGEQQEGKQQEGKQEEGNHSDGLASRFHPGILICIDIGAHVCDPYRLLREECSVGVVKIDFNGC
jgi:hypothetical protein